MSIVVNEKEGYKDYDVVYQRINVDGRPALRVKMSTPEFGDIYSIIKMATPDELINTKLLESLSDDVIDEYEDKLAYHKELES